MASADIRQLGPYRLVSLVYTGINTQLWKAVHSTTGLTYAVKVLVNRGASDRAQIGYLKWEYTVRSRLDDEHLIQILEYNVEQGTHYLVLEWCAWPNMKSWIREGLATYRPMAKKAMFEATEAIAYLHRQRLVHRDIKPDNILVSPEGDAKLIDFALVRRMGGPLGWLFPQKTKIQGTCSYISPEQIRGKTLDGRADLYSLACTFFEWVTGRTPFTGTSQNELLNKHLKAAVPSADTLNPELTPQFAELLKKAMAKNPRERFQSVPEFFGELHVTPVFKDELTVAPSGL